MQNISDRQRGRPRQFEFEHAIEDAMQVFWTKGYQGTALPDLLAATKLSRGSLYAAFGDKHNLFLLVLDRYIDLALTRLDLDLGTGGNSMAGIATCIENYVARTDGEAGQRGCLVVATAMEIAAQDQEVALRISRFFEAFEIRLSRALQRAQDDGSARKDADPAAAAYMLVCFLEGLRVVRKTRTDPRLPRTAAQTLLQKLAA
jgi:TetR/AcrR family transcriptional repressor of nem operon